MVTIACAIVVECSRVHLRQQPNSEQTHPLQRKPCIVRPGTVSLTIGQDLGSIQNYTHDLSSSHPLPFGLMAYTTIKNEHGELTGLIFPIDYGSGVEWSSSLILNYPGSSMQIGLWLVDQCDLINSGAYDYLLDQLVSYIKKNSDVAFYIRVGYEFDSYENHYDPVSYKLAFQRITRHFQQANVTNVALVWHASGFPPRDGLSLDAWYPGDEYVDWCGISLFQQPYTNDFANAEDLINFCQKHGDKPVMIAESTPYGGFVQDNDSHNEQVWQTWFIPLLAFIDKHDSIRMWSYISVDWDVLPMWRDRHAAGQSWGDTRVTAFPFIKQKWIDEVLLRSDLSSSRQFILSYPQTDEEYQRLCESAEDADECESRSASSSTAFTQSSSAFYVIDTTAEVLEVFLWVILALLLCMCLVLVCSRCCSHCCHGYLQWRHQRSGGYVVIVE